MDDESRGGSGPGGHGPTWADAMIALGQKFQDIVEWDATEFNITSSVMQQSRNRGWYLTPEQARKYGVVLAPDGSPDIERSLDKQSNWDIQPIRRRENRQSQPETS